MPSETPATSNRNDPAPRAIPGSDTTVSQILEGQDRPAVGTHYRHQSGALYEYLGTTDLDPVYRFVLALVQPAPGVLTPVGQRIGVEAAWFENAARRAG